MSAYQVPRGMLNIFNEQTHFIFKFYKVSRPAKDLKLCSVCKFLDAGRRQETPGSEKKGLYDSQLSLQH